MTARAPALPRLVVITDWAMGEAALLRAIEDVVRLGPSVAIQHRHPGADDQTFLREARALSELCRASGAPLFVNGRLDVALLVGAHLHLPARGPDVGDVRPLLAPGRIVSVAVHDSQEAARAVGADFALVSPVFGAGSKPGDTRVPLGIDGFAKLARALPCPAYALGGIDAARARELGATASGIAAITSVLRAPDPAGMASALLRAMD